MHQQRHQMGHVRRIHFVGIGGIGMSGIAEVLFSLGYHVSGSDVSNSAMTQRLKQQGVSVALGHDAQHIEGCDVVVASSAIKNDNPEIVAAHAQRIPVIPRAEMLAELMRFKYGIAIAGTHGKTTTTSLVAHILGHAGLDPTYVIGGQLNSSSANARLGTSPYLVAEADESDGSFLHLQPMLAVVTNIDQDHLANYEDDFDKLRQAFTDFLHHLPFYGTAAVCIDDPEVAALMPQISRPMVTYGFCDEADVKAVDYTTHDTQSLFTLRRPQRPDLPIRLNHPPGKHNVLNALAALTIATELGVTDLHLQEACANFCGVGRRFDMLGEYAIAGKHVTVVDDYGHHPVELVATANTIKQVWPKRRFVWCFQPHRYSRTSALFDDFAQALSAADELVLLPVYAAGEAVVENATSDALAQAIFSKKQIKISVLSNNCVVGERLAQVVQEGDVLLCQGAGSISKQIKAYLADLQEV